MTDTSGPHTDTLLYMVALSVSQTPTHVDTVTQPRHTEMSPCGVGVGLLRTNMIKIT